MTFNEKLNELIFEEMIKLESHEEVQRQCIHAQAEAAKATLLCIDAVRKAMKDSYQSSN